MNHLKRDNQKGFTIVELVVVIIILGILAATALPRFLDVTEDAHLATVKGIEGAFKSGVNLWKAHYVANNKPASASIDGSATIHFNSTNGWPAAVGDDTVSAADCAILWTAILGTNAPALSAANATVDTVEALTSDNYDWYTESGSVVEADDGDCSYAYVGRGNVAASGTLIVYDTLLGTVTRSEGN